MTGTPCTLNIWHKLLLSVLSGVLLFMSWPNIFFTTFSSWQGCLAWVSFIPYIWVWRQSGWRGAGVFAWLLGFIYFTSILSWMRLINRDTNVDNAIAWMIFAFLGGCYVGLFGATARWVKDRLDWPDAIVLPLSWTAWEYLRGHIIMGGWPWGSLGHTQYANLVVRQLAAVIGMGGISFLVMAVNVGLVNLIARLADRRRLAGPVLMQTLDVRAEWLERARRRPAAAAATATALLALGGLAAVLVTGWQAWAFARTPGQELKLALVQGNINTIQKWDQAYKAAALDKMRGLHLEAARRRPDLIAWSESCFPGIFGLDREKEWVERLTALIAKGGVPTVITGNEYVFEPSPEGERYHHFNSAFLLGSRGEVLGRYRKIKLVPFGEYIPWEILRRFLHAVVQEPIPIDFEPGREYALLRLGEHAFAPLICYEDQFEELGFQQARRGARFFIGMANDAWSGLSAMSVQHAAMSVFLAVENRAYIAKADMTGPTCVIDPWGNIGSFMPYFTEGVQSEVIYPRPFTTFFTRFGNIVPFGMLIAFGSLMAWSLVLHVFGRRTPGR